MNGPRGYVPTNVYTSSYLRHRAVQYSSELDQQSSQLEVSESPDLSSGTLESVATSCT